MTTKDIRHVFICSDGTEFEYFAAAELHQEQINRMKNRICGRTLQEWKDTIVNHTLVSQVLWKDASLSEDIIDATLKVLSEVLEKEGKA